MTGSAIYGNHLTDEAEIANSGKDVYVYSGWTSTELPDPSEMGSIIPNPSDMTDGKADLTGHYWRDNINGVNYKSGIKFTYNNLTTPLGLEVLREPVKVVCNVRTETEYTSLSDAVADAQPGDTLQLCAEKNNGGHVVSEPTEVAVNKNLTIDLNGHHLNGTSSSGILMNVAQEAKLSIRGGRANDLGDEEANEIDGVIENYGELEIGGAVSFKDRVLHRGRRLYISGGHNDIRAALDKDRYIEADPDLTMEKLEVFLLDVNDMTALNDRMHDHDDILIVHGGNQLLESVTVTPEIDNPHVRRLHKTGDKGEGLYLVDKIPSGIYLDGQDGDDKNDGSKEDTPVRTFARAKALLDEMISRVSSSELAGAAASGGQPDGIYVLNTVEVDGNESWSMPDGTMMIRHETCPHTLVSVTGNLTLENITLDGLSEGGVVAESPLIEVDGGKLTLGRGSLLKNNIHTGRTDLHDKPNAAGGILGKNKASIILDGGAVTDNEAGFGGGITLTKGTSLMMKAGEISRNRAVRRYHGQDSDAAGGGVFLGGDTYMEFSGGRISENHSDRYGGGISLGGYTTNTVSTDKDKKATLNMTGGEIDGNVSSGNGGGIFLQGNTVGYISGGSITNNRANGARNGLFAGGGIYVNSNAGVSYLDYGELYLSNVLITENTARESGGGIGACPTSVTMVYVSSGAAVYGNSAPSAHDILIDAKTGANVFIPHIDVAHVAYISHYMLGGGEARWRRDGTELYNGPEGNHELMGHSHLTTHTSLELQCGAQQDAIDKALSLAKVTISGIYSGNRGGGIGNNGNIRIGTRWELEARKVWDDADDADGIRPESVTVQLRATVHDNGQTVEIPTESIPIDTVAVLSDENGWKHTWSDLPEVIPEDNEALSQYKNLEITYSIMEVDVPDGYATSSSGNMFTNYTVTNTHQQELREIKVVKKWADAGYEGSRPEKITVELYEDGNATGKTLELTKNGNWSGQFGNLPVNKGGSRIRYSVR
ncbi:MAG: Cna B-type domain-containing protein [Lachnospiraceae bacterium]|nr:Cna B-type domain-containing protein [Lachnospiraceae bacterium]